MSSREKLNKMIVSAMLLAISLLLPLLTGQIQQIGNMLCPMHIPVILCGFFCGPLYGLIVGLIAPILRFMIFGMPQILPTGIAMTFELGAYGFFTGLIYMKVKKHKWGIIVSLLSSMIIGRIIWGIVSTIIYGILGLDFGWKIFVTGALINAIPGIIVQIILIPIIVRAINRDGRKKLD